MLHLITLTLTVSEELGTCHFIFENFITQTLPTISQTLLQSFSKIFHHLTGHLLQGCCDFFFRLCFSPSMVLHLEMQTFFWDTPMKATTGGDIRWTHRPWNITTKRNDMLWKHFSRASFLLVWLYEQTELPLMAIQKPITAPSASSPQS
jgi:hypothetical protein